MADINVERKGPSIWPWVIGLLVLALLIWAIAEMVDTDQQEVAGAEETTAEQPVAAVPAPSPETGGEEDTQDLSAVLPLGPEDENTRVMVRGEVVGQPVSDGFWLLTDQDEVLFVLSDQQVSTGQNINTTGTLRRSSSEQASSWRESAKLREAAGWRVQTGMHLHAMSAGAQRGQPLQPGQQGQPSQHGQQGQRTQPGQSQPGQQQAPAQSGQSRP